MSLPFGGPMDVAGLTQDTFRQGLQAKARSFNESDTAQDAYDGSGAALRVSDIDAYRTFSAAALSISEETNEYDGMDPTPKKKLLDYCNPVSGMPKFPCHAGTVFADIDHDKVLRICQWYSDAGAGIDGCPADYLEEVIRFSKWVKQNANELILTRTLVGQPTMSSGRHFGADFTPDQQNALVRGVWPDGKPIWDVSLAGTELMNKRIMTCHEWAPGCEFLKPAFAGDNVLVDGFEIMKGWRQ